MPCALLYNILCTLSEPPGVLAMCQLAYWVRDTAVVSWAASQSRACDSDVAMGNCDVKYKPRNSLATTPQCIHLGPVLH